MRNSISHNQIVQHLSLVIIRIALDGIPPPGRMNNLREFGSIVEDPVGEAGTQISEKHDLIRSKRCDRPREIAECLSHD